MELLWECGLELLRWGEKEPEFSKQLVLLAFSEKDRIVKRNLCH